MNLEPQETIGSLFKAFVLFFPTVFALTFSLATFVLGVGFDVICLRRLSQLILQVSEYVFAFVFLPLSQQTGLFIQFQGRQGSSSA